MAYLDPWRMTGNCLYVMRICAPRPVRHSSTTTPRSLRISVVSSAKPCAQSSRMSSALLTIAAVSVGTWSMYTVSSNEVYAFRSGPNRTPDRSRKFTRSAFGNRRVPLNAMCSTKCATPSWLSSSRMEPASTTSRSSARFSGSVLRRTRYRSPFGRRPRSTVLSKGRGASAACAPARGASAEPARTSATRNEERSDTVLREAWERREPSGPGNQHARRPPARRTLRAGHGPGERVRVEPHRRTVHD